MPGTQIVIERVCLIPHGLFIEPIAGGMGISIQDIRKAIELPEILPSPCVGVMKRV